MWDRCRRGNAHVVFLFFSNRLGCLGSLVVSLILSVVLIAVLRVLM